jgi:nitrogen fixation/metabolism regulation signal transduction histidine kinase
VLDSLLFYRGQLAEPDAGDFATAIVAVKRRNGSLGEFIERFTKVVRMPPPELRPTDVKAIVDDILRLNREQCSSRGIALGWHRCDTIAPLALDAQLIEQALLNIVKNAIEAIDEANAARGAAGGFVRLELAGEGRRVRLSVVDSGDLLASGPARPLFTPFFTTRKGGQGIGLMFVREVLQRHGCTYSLAAGAPGETRFDIWFPAA